MTDALIPAPSGDGLVLTIAGERWRGPELWRAATALANRIAGARAVAVHADASPRTAVTVLGGLLGGVPVVPVPPDSGPAERRHILTDSAAETWVGPQYDDVELPTVPALDAGQGGSDPPEPPLEAVALIMYTSGTTGPPKGVPITRRAIAADLDALAAAWAWTADDVLVHGLPLFHVHGLVLGLLGALRAGSPLIHTGRPRPEHYATAAANGGSLFFGVPTVWSRIAADPDAARGLSGARLLVSGSAGLPGPVARRLEQEAGHAPLERYGMTETLITLAAPSDRPRRVGWVGPPLIGVKARLLGPDGNPVAADGQTVGDLEVRGTTVFTGYLSAHADFSPDGWFRTGDAAVIDEEGWFRIVGRSSVDLIKSGGYRIGAGEVEAALLDHPSVREAAVVGEADDDLGQRIVAYVVGDGVWEQDLVDHVATVLASHKRPREVRLLDALPRNALGKVQKNLLVALHHR